MIGHRILAEFGADRQRIGRQRGFERQRAVEPGEKLAGLFGIEDRALDDREAARLQLEHGPIPAVRGDADEMLPLLALAVGEIIGHPPLDILPFPVEILLGLEDRAADQGVEPAADLGHPALEIEGAEFDPELLDEQLPEIRLDLVVTGAAREVAQKVRRRLRFGHRRPWPFLSRTAQSGALWWGLQWSCLSRP